MYVSENLTMESTDQKHPLGVPCATTVIYDGEPTTFQMDGDGKVILDEAIKAGVDAPYSCHAGVCATCRAKLKSGKVHMISHHALTPEEIEEGFVLTCQCIPLTPEVTVDFDW